MTIPINTTLLKNHCLAYGFVIAGAPLDQGQSIPFQVDSNGVVQVNLQSGGNSVNVIELNADDEPTTNFGVSSASFLYGYDPTEPGWDRIRLAVIFKTVIATALGSTAVWTPAAGKKFRLMGYTISVSGTLAAAGTQTIELLDSATVIKNHLATVQTTVTGDTQIGADLGQGQLSAAANNVLNVNLSTAMASGGVAVNAWGTEE